MIYEHGYLAIGNDILSCMEDIEAYMEEFDIRVDDRPIYFIESYSYDDLPFDLYLLNRGIDPDTVNDYVRNRVNAIFREYNYDSYTDTIESPYDGSRTRVIFETGPAAPPPEVPHGIYENLPEAGDNSQNQDPVADNGFETKDNLRTAIRSARDQLGQGVQTVNNASKAATGNTVKEWIQILTAAISVGLAWALLLKKVIDKMVAKQDAKSEKAADQENYNIGLITKNYDQIQKTVEYVSRIAIKRMSLGELTSFLDNVEQFTNNVVNAHTMHESDAKASLVSRGRWKHAANDVANLINKLNNLLNGVKSQYYSTILTNIETLMKHDEQKASELIIAMAKLKQHEERMRDELSQFEESLRTDMFANATYHIDPKMLNDLQQLTNSARKSGRLSAQQTQQPVVSQPTTNQQQMDSDRILARRMAQRDFQQRQQALQRSMSTPQPRTQAANNSQTLTVNNPTGAKQQNSGQVAATGM